MFDDIDQVDGTETDQFDSEPSEVSTPETVESEEMVEGDQPSEASESTDNQGISSSFDPNKLPEELKPVYKQLQADYTRKTQELAAQRKELEEKFGWAKGLADLATQDPIAAAQQLRAVADKLENIDPYASLYETTTDPTVRMLIDRLRQLEQQFGQYGQKIQMFEKQTQDATLNAQLQKLRQTYMPDVDDVGWEQAKQKILAEMEQSGIQNPEVAYKVAFFDTQRELGKKAAYESMKRKKEATLPGDTSAKTTAGKISSFEDAFRAAEAELGVRY